MFRTAPLSIISSFSPYTQQWCTSYSSFTNIYLLYLFYSKNKFEKSAHLVGFIIRNNHGHHDARSPERQISLHFITDDFWFICSLLKQVVEILSFCSQTSVTRYKNTLFNAGRSLAGGIIDTVP